MRKCQVHLAGVCLLAEILLLEDALLGTGRLVAFITRVAISITTFHLVVIAFQLRADELLDTVALLLALVNGYLFAHLNILVVARGLAIGFKAAAMIAANLFLLNPALILVSLVADILANFAYSEVALVAILALVFDAFASDAQVVVVTLLVSARLVHLLANGVRATLVAVVVSLQAAFLVRNGATCVKLIASMARARILPGSGINRACGRKEGQQSEERHSLHFRHLADSFKYVATPLDLQKILQP